MERMRVNMRIEDGSFAEFEMVASDANENYKIFCYNPQLASMIDKKLKQYNYKFENDKSEAIFKIRRSDFYKIRKLLDKFRF